MDDVGLARNELIPRAAASALEHGRIGIDTEFMSEGRYRALLCLVQIVVDAPEEPDGIQVLLIDALDDTLDFTPLGELMANPDIEVVLHAGRQDVAILRRVWNTELTNIFDTQISAGFAGASAQAGYGNLIGSILGRRVGKTASYTRWDARPLTAEQLSYAQRGRAAPARACRRAAAAPRQRGRLEWAREECRRLEGRDRRTRPRDRLGAPTARRPARPPRPRRRPRARSLARAHSVPRGPTGRLRARRPAARRARQATARRTRAASSRSGACTRRPYVVAARASSTRSHAAARRNRSPASRPAVARNPATRQ